MRRKRIAGALIAVMGLIGITLARRADEEAIQPIRKKVEEHIAKAPRNKNRPVLAETVALLIASPEFQWR